ncbi:alpha/beta fold hydrolase [Pseudomonas sp. BF-R-19]|uniref:alpha/beta fold hydrolase n=1 Tax=Pseudomonas sp. BF-R-19 TaxID=2832397 RepID=UPI001CBE21B7|nr:alpha/beta hydrolase [Pseudomonas sp. BF-R-19]
MSAEIRPTVFDTSAPPDVLALALAKPGKSYFVRVDGASVHYLGWGMEHTHKPALVFAHGLRAHARWWDFIAPYFLDDYRVVAVDFSGMGDSEHRSHYDQMTFVQDLLGVMADAGLAKAIVVGHSFGGVQVARLCATAPDAVERAIIIDSKFDRIGELTNFGSDLSKSAPLYAGLDLALQRFRLLPAQPVALPFLVDYIAKHSLRQTAEGWVWKFDRHMPLEQAVPARQELLHRIKVPVDYIYGEFSAVVDCARAEWICESLGQHRSPYLISNGYHHVMLTEPVALVSVLRTILSTRPA